MRSLALKDIIAETSSNGRAEKTVVVVAPSFAPSNYPPAIRTRFFASHLPEFGWRPIVLTVRPEYREEPQDPEFMALLPEYLEVIETRAIPQKLTRLLHFGDLGLRSFLFHLHRLTLLRHGGIDVVLIPGPPWYPFCLGPILRWRFGIPYVIDYIDPWADSVGAEAKPLTKRWIAHRLALLLEAPVARNASAIVAVSEGTNDIIRERYPGIPNDRFAAIPYGFEPQDFDAVRQSKEHSKYLAPFKQYLNLCYVGAMLPKGYGTLRALFRAVRSLRDSSRSAERLRLHFFGTSYAMGSAAQELVLPVAKEEGVGEIVREHPERIPYLEALRVLVSADLILALGSSEPHYTASKIFPNLLARRPLLAIYHEASSVCDMLRDARSGRLITFDDMKPAEAHVDEIVRALRDFLSGRKLEYDEGGIQTVAHQFSAYEMTRILAGVLDRVCLMRQPETG